MKEWFKEWFNSEEYLNVYRHRDEEDAEKLLNLILNETRLPDKANILDAACGAGRHSIFLSSKGFNVVGFDLSKTLLFRAKKDASEKNINLNLICADIRRIYFKRKFDLILNLFTSFGYFNSDEENFSFVENIFGSMNSGSAYVFDYFNKEFLLNNLVDESIKVIGDRQITERRKFEGERIVKEIDINSNGNINSYFESVRLYDAEFIIDMFEKTGFRTGQIFGDYDGHSFEKAISPRLIIFFYK